MQPQSPYAFDAGTAAVLVTTPVWWPAINVYGQMVLLLLGVGIAVLRLCILLRDLRRKT